MPILIGGLPCGFLLLHLRRRHWLAPGEDGDVVEDCAVNACLAVNASAASAPLIRATVESATRAFLIEHWHHVIAIARALEAHGDVLDGDDVRAVVGEDIRPPDLTPAFGLARGWRFRHGGRRQRAVVVA